MNQNTWSRGEKINKSSKSSFTKRKEEKQKKKNVNEKTYNYHQIKKEEQIVEKPYVFNINDHPEMVSDTQELNHQSSSSNYLEKCKILKKQESEKIFPQGWIAIKGQKGSNQIQYSRDNKNYKNSIIDTYSTQELELQSQLEEQKYILNFKNVLNDIYLKRLNESINHFNQYNEVNTFLHEYEIEIQNDLEYEKLLQEEESSSSEESDYDTDDYLSD